MSDTPLIDVRPDHWAIISAVLQEHLPSREVWAFGSRARWTAKPYSDLDLAVIGDVPLSLETLSTMGEALSESDLPYKVDVVDWATTGEAFREIIRRGKVIVRLGRSLDNAKASETLNGEFGDKTNNLADLLTYTRDGEWGNGEPTEGFSPALVVRGTDFERVRLGDLSSLPLRYIRSDILERKMLQVGDVLIETAGGTKDQPTGRSVFISRDVVNRSRLPLVCASFARFLRPNQIKVSAKFLFWKLQDEYLSHRMLPYHIQHTGVARFQYTTFATSYELAIPPLVKQTAIAEMLGALDDKIELNRRMNETLEAMARAIFKDWFVDFGPTHAKMEGRAPYLAPDIWALFPDRIDNEGKPAGWLSSPLDEIADFLNGLALQKYPAKGESYLPIIKIAQLRSGSIEGADRASVGIPPKYIVSNGDVIFSWSGSLMQRVWTNGHGALNQHLFKVTSALYPKWFYYYWVDHFMPEFQAIAASKATTMGHIQRGHLAQALATVPSSAILKAADHAVAPLFEQAIANEIENKTLAETRDLLLPKLMSGEICIRDAEKAVEAVL